MTSHERSVWYFSITQVHIYYLLLRFRATPKTPYEYLEIVSGFTQHGAVGARRFGPRSYWSLTSAWLGHLGLSKIRGGHPKIAAVLEKMRRNLRDFEGRKTLELGWNVKGGGNRWSVAVTCFSSHGVCPTEPLRQHSPGPRNVSHILFDIWAYHMGLDLDQLCQIRCTNQVVLDWWGKPKAKNHPIHQAFGVLSPACTRRVHHGHNLHTFGILVDSNKPLKYHWCQTYHLYSFVGTEVYTTLSNPIHL